MGTGGKDEWDSSYTNDLIELDKKYDMAFYPFVNGFLKFNILHYNMIKAKF